MGHVPSPARILSKCYPLVQSLPVSSCEQLALLSSIQLTLRAKINRSRPSHQQQTSDFAHGRQEARGWQSPQYSPHDYHQRQRQHLQQPLRVESVYNVLPPLDPFLTGYNHSPYAQAHARAHAGHVQSRSLAQVHGHPALQLPSQPQQEHWQYGQPVSPVPGQASSDPAHTARRATLEIPSSQGRPPVNILNDDEKEPLTRYCE